MIVKQRVKRDATISALIRAYIQRQANPDRVGCPTMETLEASLRGQLGRDAADGFYDHLSHCRECLLELKTLRDIVREETRNVGR